MASIGLDAAYFRDTSSGVAALEQTIQYKAALRAGDVFEIHSSILAVLEKTMRLRHEMYKSGTHTLAASTTIAGVHLDMNTRKGSPIPEPVRRRVLSLWPTASCLEFEISGPEMNNIDSEIESERKPS